MRIIFDFALPVVVIEEAFCLFIPNVYVIFYQKYLFFENIEIMAYFLTDKGKHGCYWETPQGYIATDGTQIFWRKGTGIISCGWTYSVCNL